MNNDWTTKAEDWHIARKIIEDYAVKKNVESLGLYEIVVNKEKKCLDFRLANWVLKLAQCFHLLYGETQGDFVTRKIITECITNGDTVH